MQDLHPTVNLILGALAGGGVAAFVSWIYFQIRLRGIVAAARHEGIEQSRSTLKGRIGEQLAPLLPGFPYLPSDARFLGDPIDYVVFNGYTAVKDDGASAGQLEIVLIDIKHGRARLSPTQRAIAEAVAAGKVRFETVRIAEDHAISVHAR